MKLFYLNIKKGKVIAIIGGLILLIFLAIIIFIRLLSNIMPIVDDFTKSFKFIILGIEMTYIEIFLMVFLFLFYEAIDAYVEGFIMVLIKIFFILFIFFIIFQAGKLPIIFIFDFFELNLVFDFSFIFQILLLIYCWVLFCEICIFFIRLKSPLPEILTTSEIRKQLLLNRKKVDKEKPKLFQIAEKDLIKKKEWVNRDEDKIIIKKEESILLNNWTYVNALNKESKFNFYFLNSAALIFGGFIYGLIQYFLFDIPAEGNYFNNFVLGLFFPIWSILITSFLSIRHYIRGFGFLVLILIVQTTLRENGIITVEGYFFLSIILKITNIFYPEFSNFLNDLTTEQLLDLNLNIFGIIMQIQFFLLLIKLIIDYLKKKRSAMEILISNRYLYLRQIETFNSWNMLFDLINIGIWPFNPINWKDFIQKLRYKRKSIQEGWFHSYGRLSYLKAIKKIKRSIHPRDITYIGAILLLILGIITSRYLFGYVFIIIAFIKIWTIIKIKKGPKIKLLYRRSKAEGSAFMLGYSDILILFDISENVANLLSSLKINQ